jgi:putative flippase GtrA
LHENPPDMNDPRYAHFRDTVPGVSGAGDAAATTRPTVAHARLDRLWDDLSNIGWLRRPMAFAERRREQILYLVIGGWNTLFGYLIWAILQYLLHDYLFYLVILVIAWFPSVVNAYFGYRWFVFRTKGPIWRELPRFSLVYVGTLVTGLIALPILLHVLPFTIYVTQALFTAVMVVVSYLSHKYFSFAKRPGPLTQDEGENLP